MASPPAEPPRRPVLALLPWGDVIEDFLAPAGLTLRDFREEMTGGWMFGFVEALRRVGVDTVLTVVSRGVAAPTPAVHAPTGTPMELLPPPHAYRALRGRTVGWKDGVRDGAGAAPAARAAGPARWARLGSYGSTPLLALGRALRRWSCAALLVQEYESPRFDACVALGRALGVPVLGTFQSGAPPELAIERRLRRAAIRASHGLVVAARAEAERVAAAYGAPPPPLARIFNPLDVGLWRPVDRDEARRALGRAPAARVVAWHGRVRLHQKGLDVLVDAWERVTRARPDADLRLLLSGTGADAGELRALLARTGARGVEWRDEYVLDRGFMRTFLSAADAYVLPSRVEGLPVAPLEAMACGLPVAAADASGVPDILEHGEADGGIVVPRDDPAALAGALGRLLDDRDLARRLGARARIRVETAFSLEAVGAALKGFLAATATAGATATPGAGATA